MISREEAEAAQEAARALYAEAGIPLSPAESVEVADFGLGRLSEEGAQIVTLVQTERLSVKVIALTPHQTLPEHWHPPVGSDPGKEETVRHVYGELYVYVPGSESVAAGFLPNDQYYTSRREIVLKPTGQITVEPGVKHWFQAGPRGAVAYSFSTVARDVLDQFSDPRVRRVTEIV